MKLYRLPYILLAALLFAACSDSDVAQTHTPGDVEQITISYATRDYGRGLSRADGATEEYCWQDMNETAVETIDLFFLDEEGKVTLYKPFDVPSEFHGRHEIVSFASDQTGDITFDIVKAASKIAMVANYHINMGDPHGKTFAEIFKDELSGLQHNRPQDLFVMYGEVIVPAILSRYANIEVPLSRVAAKIRVTLLNTDKTVVAPNEFSSMLCRYTVTSKLLPEAIMPKFSGTDIDTGALPSTTNVSIYTGEAIVEEEEGASWSYPEDIKSKGIIRENDNGQIYYTYPSDWIDYSVIKKQCTRLGQKGHNDADHTSGRRYEVIDYDDKAPINLSREMFLIVKAQYQGTWYFYKVPVNYRFASINDQQCYSMEDLTGKVFPLYRAERNTFYDITAVIDKSGAPSPDAAARNPRFTATIADMNDGGTYDYIYD